MLNICSAILLLQYLAQSQILHNLRKRLKTLVARLSRDQKTFSWPLAPNPPWAALMECFAPFGAGEKRCSALCSPRADWAARGTDIPYAWPLITGLFTLLIHHKKLARSHRVNLGVLVSLSFPQLCLWKHNNFIPFPFHRESKTVL